MFASKYAYTLSYVFLLSYRHLLFHIHIRISTFQCSYWLASEGGLSYEGPPSKVSIGPQQTVAGGGTCKSGGGTGKTMIPTFCDVIMPTPQKVTLQLFVDSPFLIRIFIVFDLFLFTFPNGQISKLPNGQISSRPVWNVFMFQFDRRKPPHPGGFPIWHVPYSRT